MTTDDFPSLEAATRPEFDWSPWATRYPFDEALPIERHGPDFLEAAAHIAGYDATLVGKKTKAGLAALDALQPILRYLYRRALYDPRFRMVVNVKGRPVVADFMPGHAYEAPSIGPRPCRVLVIGKHPGREELAQGRNFCGPGSQDLWNALDELGVSDAQLADWYFTNTVRHGQLDPASNSLPQAWVRNCQPLLQHELNLVRPDYVLCLGGDAAKALTGATGGVLSLRGRVLPYTYTVVDGGVAFETTAQLMAIVHPASVAREPDQYPDFVDALSQFVRLVEGRPASASVPLTHVTLYTEQQLARVVDAVLADPTPGSELLAVDCEWHGDSPHDRGAYLRTVQFSHRAGHAYCVVLRACGGRPVFQPDHGAAVRQLNRLLAGTPTKQLRLGGHFLQADLPWLEHAGVAAMERWGVPRSAALLKSTGGWDTGAMTHALYESLPSYKLELLCARFLGMARWDLELQSWKTQHCRQHKLKDAELEGYGECPDEVLHPYALFDVDGTRRLATYLLDRLDADQHGNSAWQGYWLNMVSALAFLEMELVGVTVDRERADALVQQYMAAHAESLAKLRELAQWPDFNPGSSPQCRELLYGEAYNGTRDKATGGAQRLRPPGAVSLGLKPIKAAGKGGRDWQRLEARHEAEAYNPAADKETLGILGHEHPLAAQLRDCRFLAQILKGVLRPPVTADDGAAQRDADGHYRYAGGLLSYVNDDGRVRTHFYPVETGRVSSSRPPMQNIGSRREGDYKRILGKQRYSHPLRSLLCAAPGHVLVEVDYKSAEVAALAWLSNDPTMIEHVRRNCLDERDPDYFDVHSNMAVQAFRLDCLPTKAGLASIERSSLRVAAKNIIFGIPYGRQPPAIARQCREEGSPIEVVEVERIQEMYFEMYAGTVPYFEECERRVVEPGWVCGTYGRYRRFPRAADEAVRSEQQRSCRNFPMQNAVADALRLAMANLYRYRARHADAGAYRLVLQIHDALLFEVPVGNVEWFLRDVVRQCMCDRVPLWPLRLDGELLPGITRPYHFGIDTKLCTHWGESVTRAAGRALGLPDTVLPDE